MVDGLWRYQPSDEQTVGAQRYGLNRGAAVCRATPRTAT